MPKSPVFQLSLFEISFLWKVIFILLVQKFAFVDDVSSKVVTESSIELLAVLVLNFKP